MSNNAHVTQVTPARDPVAPLDGEAVPAPANDQTTTQQAASPVRDENHELPPHLSFSESDAIDAHLDDTSRHLNPISDLDDVDELGKSLRAYLASEMADPISAGELAYHHSAISVENHPGVLTSERDAAKVGHRESMLHVQADMLRKATAFTGFAPWAPPAELTFGDKQTMSRREVSAHKLFWLALDDFLTRSIRFYNVKGDIVGASPDLDSYERLQAYLGDLLETNGQRVIRAGYPLPPLPKFGNHGISASKIWAYSLYSMEALAMHYRKQVENFVLFFKRLDEYLAKKGESTTREPAVEPTPSIANAIPASQGSQYVTAPSRPRPTVEEVPDEDSPPFRQSTPVILQRPTRTPAGPFSVAPSASTVRPRFPPPTEGVVYRQHEPENMAYVAPPPGQDPASRGRRYTEIFNQNTGEPTQVYRSRYIAPRTGNNDPGDSSSDSGDDSSNGNRPIAPFRPGGHRRVPRTGVSDGLNAPSMPAETPRFDLKFKTDIIPTWNGDDKVLARWMMQVNQIAKRSDVIFRQLGQLVPLRLKDTAANWYWSIRSSERTAMEADWGTMRDAIRRHWMNRRWIENRKVEAHKASYRDRGHSNESPSDYYIRKLELMELVFDYTEEELISQILASAPAIWCSLLSPHTIKRLGELQDYIRFYEDTLERLGATTDDDYRTRYSRPNPVRPPNNTRPERTSARANVAQAPTRRSSGNFSPPAGGYPFPRDDSTVSKRQTPEAAKMRPCRHCGSPKHWDYECKYSRRGERQARVNHVSFSVEEADEQEEYDEYYYGLASEDETEQGEEGVSEAKTNQEQDFRSPLQEVAAQACRVEVNAATSKDAAALEGATTEKITKIPNRKSRRRAAKEFKAYARLSEAAKRARNQLMQLPKLLARPPGTSFLGAHATKALARIGSLSAPEVPVIIDSGSDITLISDKQLAELSDPPRIRAGQRINLVQVTGSTKIDGFVAIPLFFDTPQGPVQLDTEAYVVQHMSTPFILGNDFQDQFGLSIVRKEGAVSLVFGDSERSIPVECSTTPSLIDDGGHAFNIVKLGTAKPPTSRTRRLKHDSYVRAKSLTIIPPESSKLVEVSANFPSGGQDLFVERIFAASKNPDDVFGSAHTLISKAMPKIHVANFSKKPLVLPKGEVLGMGHDPRTWLAPTRALSPADRARAEAHASLIRNLVSTATSHTDGLRTSRGKDPNEDPASTVGAEVGPKTAETPPEDIAEEDLLKEVGFSEHLLPEQRQALETVVAKHKLAFSLNGRLGHYDAKVEVPLKPDAKPVSLPPFPASPANREVMDKQMDSWLQLGVIEPSVSPWAAPVFIVWRNNKPRMVIDLRKLNESVIPDEFPIPRQDDILQALEGSQWLSTLDALSGFTQLEISEKDKEKLAFRTHRGLFQFKRMPFGYRNGPSVFQRVMQNILAPYLWVFTLVYIDDIVIYSLSFDDHVKHLECVFAAIEKAGLTLSPSKCHLGYQSLMLLGQKVSRLGISTHKDKVDAIVALEEPRSIKELQTFLGMMVYFSSYIPFYAWIAAPLFELLKKDGLGWRWEPKHQEAFELCKEVLTNAPVRAYAMPNRPYRLYSDACDYGLAAILQQVQPIAIKDLKGTRMYDRLRRAYDKKEPVPQLVTAVPNEVSDVPTPGSWASDFEDTVVYIERVIAYWSRILKAAERNYSPTEREALALKEGLIKFQAYLEGSEILAITDHAALTWSRTFQNVNKRLMTWGTVFAAYPGLHIIHRAGRVHSNVDPISRLRRRVPFQDGPALDPTKPLFLSTEIADPLGNAYEQLGARFEERLLRTASKHAETLELNEEPISATVHIAAGLLDPGIDEMPALQCYTSETHSLLIRFEPEELAKWTAAYSEDPHYKLVLKSLQSTVDWSHQDYAQYSLREDGLITFEDPLGNPRVCVPQSLRTDIMHEIHDGITEGAHAGYHRCYNRIASIYYWPRMARDIKQYVSTCDICQKAKPRRHAPVGLLRPIPIPSRPFEVVTMDFIPELPLSDGFDNVLVIVDKLTKYALFIPCSTSITEVDTARLFFQHVISEYGIPKQIISDRDARWRGEFWHEVCKLLDTTRALTTSYHPQADGQTEVMNQTLEIALRAYVGPTRDDWSSKLCALQLAYNTTPHSATGYSPAYLLRGYQPRTVSSFLHDGDDVHTAARGSGLVPEASALVEGFEAEWAAARDALAVGQAHQQRAYNNGRLITEFEEGDKVVLNVDSLELLRAVSGRGRKLLMKYDGPFEVLRKLSPVSYQLRLPASYGMHPIVNIAHLERYHSSPPELGERPHKQLLRSDFTDEPEFEVERILRERTRAGRNGRRVVQYLTRFKDYSEEWDEWLTRAQLRNAPDILKEWARMKKEQRGDSRSHFASA